MAKNQTAKKQDYFLVIERVKSNCKFLSVTADFNPQLKSNSQFEQIVPVFNKDKNYFTPSFILKGDKTYFEGSYSFEKLQFEEKVRNSYEKNLPKNPTLAEPSSNYCQICQRTFEGYLTHINNPEHQKANRKSQANQMIFQICQQYEKVDKKAKPIKKETKKTWKVCTQQNMRILRSCGKNYKPQEQLAKHFSFISTKLNTSHVNGL